MYKPFSDTPKTEEKIEKKQEFITKDEFEERIMAFDTQDIIQDLKEVKEKLKDFYEELEKLKNTKEVKEVKGAKK